ncbi:carotenoid 9,10(9',10')-cleavage dioxygenase 1-like isoform X2 [Sesamum indicum]|uniref:Carotenoid 9,10(9',10')-cleavage dioxygenase 1-like isoform X2 n=1 Tax=Sesamum indicum TaxID=4182 RepID=A0A8M8V1E8_SESIN|nr:carotenoid 9,10(9',10')-cleavage dioxygenase 1-like isoform X2 [Sesamum indicum]
MATSCSYYAFPLMISCTAESRPPRFGLPKPSTSSSSSAACKVMKLIPYHRQISTIMDLPIKEIAGKLLEALVDHVFEFVDQPYLPSQSNFAPVDEIGEPVRATLVHGSIPHDLPEGVYIRTGSNPLHGVQKSAVSIFGKSSHVWVEGEGMIHALYFNKDSSDGGWTTFYNNKYVSTDTFELEKEKKKPVFLPATEGDPPAVLSAFLLNLMRFGVANKNMSNTNVFEHAGKHYTISENDVAPYEIDIRNLETIGTWDEIADSWNRPFTSHPKKAPRTGELVTIGIDAKNPYLVLGVISADGKKLIHKVDLRFKRSILCHEMGVTQRLIRYEKEEYARIGVMPRYGEVDSVRWFEVKPCCAFHIINCYEEDDEVVVMGCRAQDSIIPGPDLGKDKLEWFSRGFKKVDSYDDHSNMEEGFLFARPYEWRLNMKTGQVKERYLVGLQFSMDFPIINHNFTGLKTKYAYTQLVHSHASSAAGMVKYGGLAKLCLQDNNVQFLEGTQNGEGSGEEYRKIEYHMFPENTFCTGASFVAKQGSVDEDDGWLITFVHNEDTNTSEVYIVDAKKISSEAVAKIRLPCRVPYGFHGAYMHAS